MGLFLNARGRYPIGPSGMIKQDTMTYRQAVATAFVRVLRDSNTPGPRGLEHRVIAEAFLRLIRASRGR